MSNLTEKQRQEVEEMIMRQAVDGRIGCGKARAIAESLDLPIKSVGMVADDLSIKISQCELGCF